MKIVRDGQKYRLCGFVANLRALSVGDDGILKAGCYMGKLLNFVQIFEQVYRNYSPFERENALIKISDLSQFLLDEKTADQFFISEDGFLGLDFNGLEDYMGEKTAIILNFVRLALGRRQEELGIYNDSAVQEARLDLSADRVDKLRSDLAAIHWFVLGDLCQRLETYYVTTPDSGYGFQVLDDVEEESPAEIIRLDNFTRPDR